MAVCVSLMAGAQYYLDTIHTGDPRYFLIDSSEILGFGHSLSGCGHTRGRVYTFEESDSMRVWGMACAADSISTDLKCSIQLHLFRVDDDFDTTGQYNIMFDSVTLELAVDVDFSTPARWLTFSSGQSVKMYEVYFDTAITLVGTYGVCMGELWGGDDPIFNFHPWIVSSSEGVVLMTLSASDYNPSGKSRAAFGKGPGADDHYPVFLITDSSLRWEHPEPPEPPEPPAAPCPTVGRLSVDSTGARCVRLTWEDTVERCYYEVAIGPVSSPVDALTLHTTTDTFFFFDHLPPGVPYKALVRGACDCEGDVSAWGNLAAFTYTPYHLNLYANNPDWGSVLGGGEFYGETLVEISASPADERCSFVGWDDGPTDNPRYIFLLSDTAFTAIFAYDSTEVGTDAVERMGLRVSPNPVRHSLRVRTDMEVRGTLVVFNAEGQRLTSETMEGREARMDVSSLPAGQYLLRLETREASATARFVKR